MTIHIDYFLLRILLSTNRAPLVVHFYPTSRTHAMATGEQKRAFLTQELVGTDGTLTHGFLQRRL